MAMFATRGSKLYIGSAPIEPSYTGDLLAAAYTGQTWTEIGGLEKIGAFGDTAEIIESDQIGVARTIKMKGVRDAGNLEVVAALIATDVGQIAVVAAEKTDQSYPFRVVFKDQAPGDTTGSERRFIALVVSAVEALEEASNIAKFNFQLAINSNVVRIAAD